MNYKEANNYVRSKFPLKGFSIQKGFDGGRFITIEPTRKLDIGYGMVNYIDEFHVGWFAGIRINVIEDIFFYAIENYPKYKGLGGTIGIHDSDTGQPSSRHYTIHSPSDIDDMYTKLAPFFEKALQFFDQYKTLEDIDKYFNITKFQSGNFLYRINGEHGIIAAKLTRNPRLQEYIERYRKNLVDTNNPWLSEYEKVVAYISSRSVEELMQTR